MQARTKYVARYIFCIWVLRAVCTMRANIWYTENGWTITWWIQYRIIAHWSPILARMHLIQVSFRSLMWHYRFCTFTPRFGFRVFLLTWRNGFHIPSGFPIRLHTVVCQQRRTSWWSSESNKCFITTKFLNFKDEKKGLFLQKITQLVPCIEEYICFCW